MSAATIKREFELGLEAGRSGALDFCDPSAQDVVDGWRTLADAMMPKVQWPFVWLNGFMIGYFECNEQHVPEEDKSLFGHAQLMNQSVWRLV
jgi:hypothetical protein